MIPVPPRRRRPPPILIPEIRPRDEEDSPKKTSTPQRASVNLPSTSRPSSPTSQVRVLSRPTSTVAAQPQTRLPSSSISFVLPLSTIKPQSSPTQTRTTLFTIRTTTSSIVIPTSLKSPKEKEKSNASETPDATQTVFLSLPPELITVTAIPPAAATTTTISGNQNGAQQEEPPPAASSVSNGGGGLPPGAIPLITAFSVLAGIAMLASLAIILYRRKKARKASEAALQQQEQPNMSDRDSGGFRAVPDTQPILQR